jgi:hypothetical protein
VASRFKKWRHRMRCHLGLHAWNNLSTGSDLRYCVWCKHSDNKAK